MTPTTGQTFVTPPTHTNKPMAVLVDYFCDVCSSRTEEWMPSPPASNKPCPACGGQARRLFSPVGLMRGAKEPVAHTPASAKPLCLTNPDVPGLCHMTPAAGRAWLARARKDNRSLERELASQEVAAKIAAPTIDAVVSHHHHGNHGNPATSSESAKPAHSHDHGSHSHGAGEAHAHENSH